MYQRLREAAHHGFVKRSDRRAENLGRQLLQYLTDATRHEAADVLRAATFEPARDTGPVRQPGLVPIDFERETLAGGLAGRGFDPAQQTFFTWLGVVPYLTEEAVWSTLGFIASLPNGAHVVFDYSDPPDSLSAEMRQLHERRAARVAELGEPWVNYFESEKLHAKLTALGFASIEDLGPPGIAARYFPSRAASVPARGGHILRAANT